jgi:hypothetical protein
MEPRPFSMAQPEPEARAGGNDSVEYQRFATFSQTALRPMVIALPQSPSRCRTDC